MSGGAMLYAVDLDSVRAAFAGRSGIPPFEMFQHLEANAHMLPNSAHSPARLDDLLALDAILDGANYPPEFRYATLLFNAAPLNVEAVDESAFVGCVSASVVTEVAERVRTAGAPHAADSWQ